MTGPASRRTDRQAACWLIKSGQHTPGKSRQGVVGQRCIQRRCIQRCVQQRRQERPFVYKDTHKALRLRQGQAARQQSLRLGLVTVRRLRLCLQQQEFNRVAQPAAGLSHHQQPRQERQQRLKRGRVGCPAQARQQTAGQRDMRKLAPVGQVVVQRQPLRTHPALRFQQPSLSQPDARPQRADWAIVGCRAAQVEEVGLL